MPLLYYLPRSTKRQVGEGPATRPPGRKCPKIPGRPLLLLLFLLGPAGVQAIHVGLSLGYGGQQRYLLRGVAGVLGRLAVGDRLPQRRLGLRDLRLDDVVVALVLVAQLLAARLRRRGIGRPRCRGRPLAAGCLLGGGAHGAPARPQRP